MEKCIDCIDSLHNFVVAAIPFAFASLGLLLRPPPLPPLSRALLITNHPKPFGSSLLSSLLSPLLSPLCSSLRFAHHRLDNPVPGFPLIPNPQVEGAFLGGREIYQLIGFCTKFGVACDIFENPLFAAIIDESDVNVAKAFSSQLDADFKAVTDLWTGTGPINSNPDDVSLFCAYMKELPSQAFLVDFFFSKDFSKTNLVSKYSRSITRWGAPNEPHEDYKDWEDERKNYVLDNFFDDMDKIAR